MDKKAECDLLSTRCHVCRQSRPCCRQPLIELWERDHHEKFIHPVKGPLIDAWGLGSVWVTCCAAYYGMYYDEKTTAYQPVLLGHSEEEAIWSSEPCQVLPSHLLLKMSGARSLGQ